MGGGTQGEREIRYWGETLIGRERGRKEKQRRVSRTLLWTVLITSSSSAAKVLAVGTTPTVAESLGVGWRREEG